MNGVNNVEQILRDFIYFSNTNECTKPLSTLIIHPKYVIVNKINSKDFLRFNFRRDHRIPVNTSK